MSYWDYEPRAEYLKDYCIIKKRLFGKKLVNLGYGHYEKSINMPRGSKVKVKVENDSAALYINKELFNETQFNHFWFDEKKPNILYAQAKDDKRIIMIDCLTGKHTPVAETIRNQNICEAYPYLIDFNGHILKINEDLSTTDTGLVRVDEHNRTNNLVAKNAEGKYVLLNIATLKPLVDKEFDNKNIEPVLILEGRTISKPDLRVFSNDRDLYFIDKNNNLFDVFKADSISRFRSKEKTIEIVRLYDKEKNITTLIKLDTENNKIVETKQFNNFVCDYYIKDGKNYYIISDRNSKMGVVDENDNQIIPNKYDKLETILMDSKESSDAKINKNGDEVLWAEEDNKKGVFSLDGQELLPCEYKNIVLEQSIKLDDTYRFLAQNKDDAFGVMNSKGEIEINFGYRLVDRAVLVKDKSAQDEVYHDGIVIAPILPKQEGYVSGFEVEYELENSIYIRDKEKCYLYMDDAEIKNDWKVIKSSKSLTTNLKGETQETEIPAYSDLDIFMYGSIIGNLVDNPGLGQVIARGAMGSQTRTVSSNNEEDEMDF